jgi:predicted signal transduction protein with EAL and GGDEF domain
MRLLIGDHGTGSSCVAHPNRLPVGELNVDRTWLRRRLQALEATLNAVVAAPPTR